MWNGNLFEKSSYEDWWNLGEFSIVFSLNVSMSYKYLLNSLQWIHWMPFEIYWINDERERKECEAKICRYQSKKSQKTFHKTTSMSISNLFASFWFVILQTNFSSLNKIDVYLTSDIFSSASKQHNDGECIWMETTHVCRQTLHLFCLFIHSDYNKTKKKCGFVFAVNWVSMGFV